MSSCHPCVSRVAGPSCWASIIMCFGGLDRCGAVEVWLLYHASSPALGALPANGAYDSVPRPRPTPAPASPLGTTGSLGRSKWSGLPRPRGGDDAEANRTTLRPRFFRRGVVAAGTALRPPSEARSAGGGALGEGGRCDGGGCEGGRCEGGRCEGTWRKMAGSWGRADAPYVSSPRASTCKGIDERDTQTWGAHRRGKLKKKAGCRV